MLHSLFTRLLKTRVWFRRWGWSSELTRRLCTALRWRNKNWRTKNSSSANRGVCVCWLCWLRLGHIITHVCHPNNCLILRVKWACYNSSLNAGFYFHMCHWHCTYAVMLYVILNTRQTHLKNWTPHFTSLLSVVSFVLVYYWCLVEINLQDWTRATPGETGNHHQVSSGQFVLYRGGYVVVDLSMCSTTSQRVAGQRLEYEKLSEEVG